MVAQKIKESYGSLLNINTDMADVMAKAKNSWTSIFLELFKYLLGNVGSYQELIDNHVKLFANAAFKINSDINDARTAAFQTPEYQTRLSQDLDYIDLTTTEDNNTRITNPAADDMLPFIMISKSTAFEHVLDKFNGLFPYDKIPVMTIHQSGRSLYRWYKLYKRYVTAPDIELHLTDANENFYAGTRVEISQTSLMRDISQLFRFYDINTQTLNDDGLELLKNTVLRYTDFIIPLIAINTRIDFDLGESFIETIYNLFNNQYTGALYFQKQMFETMNAIMQSNCGIPMFRLYNIGKSVSTLDLINPNCKYNTLLHETLSNNLNCEGITNYSLWCKDIAFPIEEELANERLAFSGIARRIIDCILLGFILDRNPDPRTNFQKKLSEARCMLFKIRDKYHDNPSVPRADSGIGFIYDTAVNLLEKGLSDTTIALVQEKINSVNYNKDAGSVPAHKYNNDSQFAYPGVYNDEFLNTVYKFTGKNSAAQEHASIAREIYRDKKSFAAMRDIGVRVSEISCYEDALGLLMDANSYLDIFNHSKSTVMEDADAGQFKLLLLNTRAAMKKQIEEFRPSC